MCKKVYLLTFFVLLLGLASSYFVASAAEPIHRYSFIDGDTVAVDSVGGRDGTLEGTAVNSGNKLVLDGTGHVNLPSDILDPCLTSVTIEAWFELSADAIWARLFNVGDTNIPTNSGGYYLIYVPRNGEDPRVQEFTISTTGFPGWQMGEEKVRSTLTPLNTRTHIACAYDGSTTSKKMKIYNNGALVADANVTYLLSDVRRVNTYIGDSSYPDDPNLKGTVDEFRIYDTALTDAEVLASYNAGSDVHMATEPNPSHASTVMTRNVTLSWTPAVGADKHDVYFGSDFSTVHDANRDNEMGVLVGKDQDPNNYLVEDLVLGTTYYWRIDEINDAVITKGNVWNFFISGEKSWEPTPYDTELCVYYDPCTVLSWNPGSKATQSELYFGTSADSLVWEANIPHTGLERYSYDKTGLSPEIDYYWRVDEVNGPNIWTGDVWTFRTIFDFQITDINLVGWWPCDCPDNPALDWSGNGQDGNVYDATVVEGFEGWALNFNGASQYVELPIGDTIATLNSTTIATWVNFANIGDPWQRIFDFGNGMEEGYMFLTPRVSPEYWPAAPMRFAITPNTNGNESQVDAPTLPTGWHHVAVTIDENTMEMTLYLDGVSIATASTATLPSNLGSTTQNWLGRSQWPWDAYFIGIIDDFRIYDYALTDEEIKSLMTPLTAWLPVPADSSGGVQTNPTLIWEPGKFADLHDIYFGTDETAVADANLTVTLGVLEKQGYDSNSYGPLALEYETTYYWRIDEVNGLDTWKGDVWSFTTEPNIPITDPNLLCWLTFDEGQGSAAIDSSGHSNHGTIVGDATWGSGMLEGALELDGTDDYVALPIGDEVNSMNDVTIATWVNFSNEGGEWQRIFDFGNGTNEYMFLTPRLGAGGVMRFAISLSSYNDEDVVNAPATLASGWHHVTVMIDSSTTPYTLKLFLDGAEVGFNPSGDVLPSDLGATTNNWLGRSQYAGDAYFTGSLDDFRIYNKLLPEEELRELVSPPWAWGPNPLDGATNVKSVPKPILSWFPGKYAHKHDVYFGTDGAAVTDANRSNPLGVLVSQNQDACSYDPCEIDFGTTYYWRVDEVNMSYDPNIIRGYVWSFTTANYILIDNFDQYPSRNDLRTIWKDGYVAFTNGSNVTISRTIDSRYPAGHQAPGPIHQGSDALQLVYDNDKNIWIYVPGYSAYNYSVAYYYSEMEATIDDLECVSDWKTEDVKMLSLQFSGDPDNDIGTYEQMYIALEDGGGDVALLKYGDSNGEDANNLLSREWAEWAIDLNEFEMVNPLFDIGDVNKVYIGFGERLNNTNPGGSGVVYIDSIRLDWAKCVPEMASVGDLSDDCTIDLFDFIQLIDSLGAEPSAAVPIIDLKANDYSAGTWLNTDGSLGGQFDINFFDINDMPTSGTIDGLPVVTFDGNDYLIADFNAPGGITGANDFTVVMKVFNPAVSGEEIILTWARRSGTAGTSSGVGYGTSSASGAVVHWNVDDQTPDMGFDGGVPAGDMWHQIAVTYNGITEKILVDGKLNAVEGSKILDVYADNPVVVGGGYNWDPNDPNDFIDMTLNYYGSVNRIRVYDEALSQAQLEFIATGSYSADLNGDGEVDFKDLAMLLDEWLKEELFP